jgi:hypothetical protein
MILMPLTTVRNGKQVFAMYTCMCMGWSGERDWILSCIVLLYDCMICIYILLWLHVNQS